jgi:hypothetical protein
MDDFTFDDASVWGTSSAQDPKPPQEPLAGSSSSTFTSPSQNRNDTFGDDDFDFGAPSQNFIPITEDEDDFGDFGDFGDADADSNATAFADDEPSAFTSQDFDNSPIYNEWEALRLDPMPPGPALRSGIGDILRPFWDKFGSNQFLTDEDIRQVGGTNQILVSPER